MKVEMDVFGSPSLIVLMVSVDVKKYWKKKTSGWVVMDIFPPVLSLVRAVT